MCARPIVEQDAKWKTYLEVIGALVDPVEEWQCEPVAEGSPDMQRALDHEGWREVMEGGDALDVVIPLGTHHLLEEVPGAPGEGMGKVKLNKKNRKEPV